VPCLRWCMVSLAVLRQRVIARGQNDTHCLSEEATPTLMGDQALLQSVFPSEDAGPGRTTRPKLHHRCALEKRSQDPLLAPMSSATLVKA
jgi:hypothetical protein